MLTELINYGISIYGTILSLDKKISKTKIDYLTKEECGKTKENDKIFDLSIIDFDF